MFKDKAVLRTVDQYCLFNFNKNETTKFFLTYLLAQPESFLIHRKAISCYPVLGTN